MRRLLHSDGNSRLKETLITAYFTLFSLGDLADLVTGGYEKENQNDLDGEVADVEGVELVDGNVDSDVHVDVDKDTEEQHVDVDTHVA